MISKFSHNKKLYAAVTATNHVKVWDATSGALRVQLVNEKVDLASKITCLAFGVAKKNSYVAVGTEKGHIIVWDIKRNTTVCCIETDKRNAVSDVAFSRNGKNIFSSSKKSKNIFEWQIQSGKKIRTLEADKHGTMKLAVSSDNARLAAVGTSIHIIDISSGVIIANLRGHSASEMSSLLWSDDSQSIVSSSGTERSVLVWSVKAAELAEENDVVTPTNTLMARNELINASFYPISDGYHVLATTKTGAVSLWKAKNNSNGKPQFSKVSISEDDASKTAGEPHILSATFIDASNVIVVTGLPSSPVFQRVCVVQDGNLANASVAVQKTSAALFGTGMTNGTNGVNSNGNGSVKHNVHVLTGAESSAAGVAAASTAIDSAKKRARSRSSSEVSTSSKRRRGDDLDLSLEERAAVAAKRASHRLRASESLNGLVANGEGSEKLEASSLSTMLEQALQSNDRSLIEHVLAVQDEKVVTATMDRLSPRHLMKFFDILFERLEAKPSRGTGLVIWFRAATLRHSSFLLSLPDLSKRMAGIQQLIESRLALRPKFSSLLGRLELLLAQVNRRRAAESTAAAASTHKVVEYEESSSEEEDAEESEEEEERIDDNSDEE